MNYLKIYKAIIEKAKAENRKKNTEIYYEMHHIIPDFMFKNRKRRGPKGHLDGNPNDAKNIVLLTEREHIICHVLLAKALQNKRYWAQAASALTWFFTKVIDSKHPRQKNRLAGLSKKYEKYRKLGLDGISSARRGKMPVVDAITRESIGSVPVNHPKVLSGEWIHHSKGRIVTDKNTLLQNSLNSAGEKNGRYSGITNDELIEKYCFLSMKLGFIPLMTFFRKWFFYNFNKNVPQCFTKFRFNYGKDFYPIIEDKTGLKYNRYSKKHWKLNIENLKYAEN